MTKLTYIQFILVISLGCITSTALASESPPYAMQDRFPGYIEEINDSIPPNIYVESTHKLHNAATVDAPNNTLFVQNLTRTSAFDSKAHWYLHLLMLSIDTIFIILFFIISRDYKLRLQALEKVALAPKKKKKV